MKWFRRKHHCYEFTGIDPYHIQCNECHEVRCLADPCYVGDALEYLMRR